jgi:tetratricopeptide (TPR) repeat protein
MRQSFSVVQVCDFPANGQGYHRYHEPSRALSRLAVTVVDCDPLHRALPALAEAADVLILQVYDWDWLPVIEQRRARGRATVVEASDYYFDVQPFNPGSLAWADPARRECLTHLLGAADAVQTTSAALGRHWKRWARRVAVFANQLPDVPPLSRRSGPLTVGWAGSGSHLADWYAVAPVVQAWLESHPDVRLAVMTDEQARSFVRLPAERYHFRGLGTLAEYLAFLRTLDVGLAPLLPTEFNRCRSDLKHLEYAAHGVVGVYSDLEPFRGVVRHGQTGLLFRSADELRRCLDALISDAALRDGIRQRAYENVLTHRLLRDHAGERLAFYRDLVRGPGTLLPPELLASAVRDGDYYQLRQAHPERVLAASIERPADPQTFAALARLTQEHATYEAALQQIGHALNEACRPGDALVPLDRALGANPHSCRSLCEVSRSLAAVGESAAAKECLERALELCPAHPLAWKRLLALADALVPRPLPSNYEVELAALPLLSHEEALSRLEALIESYATTLNVEERPAAVAAFSKAIQAVVRPGDPSLRLLRRAAEAFPESGRIGALLAEALDHAGLRDEAQEQAERVAAMARQAELWRLEAVADDPLLRRCRVAEYARRHSTHDAA